MFAYTLGFVGIVLAFGLYSLWARLDPRWTMVGALFLFLGAALARALGLLSAGDLLTEYGLIATLVGFLLILIAGSREMRSWSGGASAGPAP